MSDEEEHESRCGESFPVCALNAQRSTATSARCSFPLAIRVQHGARGEDLVCGSAASLPPCHENETLRSRQNQCSATDPMHQSGARSFTVRPWLVNEGQLSLRIEFSAGKMTLD